jgi:glycosyltransferase involved in cell wall biosynthesis
MLTILNVNHLIDPVTGGGTAERTFQMSCFLAKNGFNCLLLTTDKGVTPERIQALHGVNITLLPSLSERFFIPRSGFSTIRELVHQADIIHLMGHWTVLNALVYYAARMQKKPYVICPAGALPIYGRSKILKKIYNILVGHSIIANARAWIAVTPEETEHFAPYGVTAGQIAVIPNGVDLADFLQHDDMAFRNRYKLGKSPFILFMGRLNMIKGPDLLLQAFARIADQFLEHHLVMAGPDGGMADDLINTAQQLGLMNRIHFIGYIGGTEKSYAYAAADLLVIPSRQEAMSIVVLEAGAGGTPVLLTDQCGFDEVAAVEGGKVVPATAEGLAEGLAALLGQYKELPRMGNNLKKFVTQQFAWQSLVGRYIQLYQKLLADQ